MRKLIILVTVFIFCISCKKYNQDFIGAPLGVASKDFRISNNSFSASDTFPVFQNNGSIYFISNFNEQVSWKIRITGLQSGAIKNLSGLSSSLDSSNTKWDGSTDTTRLFRDNEQVKVTLTITGYATTLKTTLTIKKIKDHGITLATFEAISPDGIGNFFDQFYWFSKFDATEKTFFNKYLDPDAPQGAYVLKMSGSDKNSNFYIGKAGLSANTPNKVFNFGTSNPNTTYFNLYVKGTGSNNPNPPKFVIECFEDDNGDKAQDYYGGEDKYTYTIPLNFDGWKFVSVKYANFGRETSGGNNTSEPNKISNIGFYFGPQQGTTDVLEVSFDFPVITTNGPMIP